MFAKHLIAAAAVAGLMATGAFVGTAAAQTTAPAAAPAKPMAKKAAPKHAMHHAMHHAHAKMSKAGHKMDNVADKLNACEMKPSADRQACISDATKM